MMKSFFVVLFIGIILLSNINNILSLDCALQTGPDGYDTITDCETYCVVLYYKNTMIPSFVTSDPICSAFGCAELDSEGIPDLSTIEGDDFPASGNVDVLKITDAARTESPENVEAGEDEPVNVYRSWDNPPCVGLEVVATVEKDESTGSGDIMIYAGLAGGAITGVVSIFFIYKFF